MAPIEQAEGEAGTAGPDPGRFAVQWDDADPHIARISRLGRSLFKVAGCHVSFDGLQGGEPDEGDAERAFFREVSLCDEPVVVRDTRLHLSLREHRAVTGAPHIRFYAAYPLRGQHREPAGSISLVDYAPRPDFGFEQRRLLGDLAALVERELHLRSVSATQRDLQKQNKHLRRKSLVDPLIGTWNRGAIMRILSIEAVRCEKAGLPLSLIVADLDHFKQINDRFGHPAGDAVLVKVASRLRSCIRPQEALGRYGGEEFLVVLPGASLPTALAIAERMRAAVAGRPETVAGTTLALTISAGVASTETFASASMDELISRADVALYKAKDKGRNCVVSAVSDLS
ncbi:MAG TPA: sensor domain-containing diguanylate cyclase [Noviherbaspirillum sp.]|nr:sensor domain-containing diguanylate cyclase [Noviherbaspirillum sp.]